MTHYLQSPSGDLAAFEAVYEGWMALVMGGSVVEIPISDARKVWQALRLAQWQQADREAIALWNR